MRAKKWLVKSAQWLGMYEFSNDEVLGVYINGVKSVCTYRYFEKWLNTNDARIMIENRFATLGNGYFPRFDAIKGLWEIHSITIHNETSMIGSGMDITTSWVSAMFYEIYSRQL